MNLSSQTNRIITATTLKAVSLVRNPRYFRTERGYQGAFLAALGNELTAAGVVGHGVIPEEEYQKTFGRHGITDRPDIIVHIPTAPSSDSVRTGNLAVYALKLQASADDAKDDFDKIDRIISHLNYAQAFFININSSESYLAEYSGPFNKKIHFISVLPDGSALRVKHGYFLRGQAKKDNTLSQRRLAMWPNSKERTAGTSGSGLMAASNVPSTLIYYLAAIAMEAPVPSLDKLNEMSIGDIKAAMNDKLNIPVEPFFMGWKDGRVRNAIAHSRFSYDSKAGKMRFQDLKTPTRAPFNESFSLKEFGDLATRLNDPWDILEHLIFVLRMQQLVFHPTVDPPPGTLFLMPSLEGF